MANHKHQHLDPAYSVVLKFRGDSGKLRDAIEAVAKITGVHPTRVYRWMHPTGSGGTGGNIPSPHMRKLLDHAREKEMPLSIEDFFSEARAA